MIKFFLAQIICFTSILTYAQVDTSQHIIAGRKNDPSQYNKPYVILISADGFRYDFAKRYHADKLLSLSRKGVKAASLIPSFPSVTFPNHYSIATGMYPSHHGLVNNNFYDPQRNEIYALGKKDKVEDGTWYGGIPLWVLAEQQKMLTASFYWVGSEAAIKGIYPTYYYRYNENINIDKRIQVVLDWLHLPEEKRPHLITFYFPEVDHAAHTYGPVSQAVQQTVNFIDSSIDKLSKAVRSTGLKVNFIFLSDHGMTTVDTINTLLLPKGIDTSKFIIPAEGVLLTMHAKNKNDVQPAYNLLKQNENNYTAYLKENMPAHLHYGLSDDKFNRMGDILLIPKWPYVFNLKKRKINIGWHGYDPSIIKDMHATFFAWGPAFKKKRIASFENVHVYPVVAKILDLPYTHQIDGNIKVLENVLRKKQNW